MQGNEGHVVVLVADGLALVVIVVILLKLRIDEAVGGSPQQVIVDGTAAQRQLGTAAIALAGIDDDASVAVGRTHSRQLLVTNLRIE